MAGSKQAKESKVDLFSVMATWQFMAFGLLLVFVWANEVLDFPHRVFDTPPAEFNLYRGCLLSAAIVTVGIIAVGHTYERQRKVVEELLKTCLYCHRIQGDGGKWEHVEEYFLRHYPISMNREPCPECAQMLKSVDAKVEEAGEKKS